MLKVISETPYVATTVTVTVRSKLWLNLYNKSQDSDPVTDSGPCDSVMSRSESECDLVMIGPPEANDILYSVAVWVPCGTQSNYKRYRQAAVTATVTTF